MADFKFSPTSRYAGIETYLTTLPDGRTASVLRRRFVPAPERFTLLQEHVVGQDERIDRLASQYLGDPLAFWRIADANGALQPEALTATMGRRLRITLPEGLPGIAPTGLTDV
jgi:hypothetical protein